MIAGGGFLSRPRHNIGDDLVRWLSRRQRERARVLSQQSNGERESHNDGDFVDRREKSGQGRRKTNATTKEGSKQASGRPGVPMRNGRGRERVRHTPGVTGHAYMNE